MLRIDNTHLLYRSSPSFETSAVKPYITSPPNGTIITVDEGKSFQLNCVASGVPAPNLRWRYQGADIASSVQGSAVIGRQLEKNSISHFVLQSKPDQSGVYTCIADQNLLGQSYSDSRIVNVNVKGENSSNAPIGGHCIHWTWKKKRH